MVNAGCPGGSRIGVMVSSDGPERCAWGHWSLESSRGARPTRYRRSVEAGVNAARDRQGGQMKHEHGTLNFISRETLIRSSSPFRRGDEGKKEEGGRQRVRPFADADRRQSGSARRLHSGGCLHPSSCTTSPVTVNPPHRAHGSASARQAGLSAPAAPTQPARPAKHQASPRSSRCQNFHGASRPPERVRPGRTGNVYEKGASPCDFSLLRVTYTIDPSHAPFLTTSSVARYPCVRLSIALFQLADIEGLSPA